MAAIDFWSEGEAVNGILVMGGWEEVERREDDHQERRNLWTRTLLLSLSATDVIGLPFKV